MCRVALARKEAMRVVRMLLLVFLLTARAGGSALTGETAHEEKAQDPMPDRAHTAVMSKGTFSSPMTSDRKTVIVATDGTVVAEEIYCSNLRFYAYAELAKNKTTVYGTEWQGGLGRRAKLWSMDGCFDMLGLSNDGRRLVLGCGAAGSIPEGSAGDLVVLSFVDEGRLAHVVRLDQVITDLSSLRLSGDGYYWGRYVRLNAAGHYVVETVEGETILFDIDTGERVNLVTDTADRIPGWKTYRDILMWYEFQYPEELLIKDHTGPEGYPTGSTLLRREGSDWIINMNVEKIADYRGIRDSFEASFEEFVVERAKSMNCADGPDGSVYVDDIAGREAFRNSHGLEVLKIMLSVVHESFAEGEKGSVERRLRGPIYAVMLLPKPDEPRRVLFISPASGGEDNLDYGGLLRRITETVRYPG
jgi:hypothetical protein